MEEEEDRPFEAEDMPDPLEDSGLATYLFCCWLWRRSSMVPMGRYPAGVVLEAQEDDVEGEWGWLAER